MGRIGGFCGVLLLGRLANAQVAPAAPPSVAAEQRSVRTAVAPRARQTRLRWYGYQPLAIDAGAFVGLVAAQRTDSSEIQLGGAILCSAAYAAGGPLVHASYEHWGRTSASISLRLGLPTLGFLVGRVTCSGRQCDEAPQAMALGIVAGSLLDAAVVSWDRTPVKQHTLLPTLQVSHDGAFVGAVGAF